MGTVSLRLHDGTAIRAEFQDDHDGRVSPEELERAQNRLRAELQRTGYSGWAQVDSRDNIVIVESGSVGQLETQMGTQTLRNSGVLRLFAPRPDVLRRRTD